MKETKVSLSRSTVSEAVERSRLSHAHSVVWLEAMLKVVRHSKSSAAPEQTNAMRLAAHDS